MDFSSLKNDSMFDKVKEQFDKATKPNEGGRDDDRFWTPTVDKAGNGMAIVRFLPAAAVDGEGGVPFVQVYSHGFQGTGGWLIEECPTTIGDKCYVCEQNSVLWNSGFESDKEIVRKRKRKLHYISNVYVISDPSNPENEGKVKLFKYGKKIFDKLNEAMNPQFADETPINPFHMWNGANFKLKMRKVDGFRNYDKSEFESPSPLLDGDDRKLEAIWKSEYSLKGFTESSNFKSYDDIKKRFDLVVGTTASNSRAEDTEEVQQEYQKQYNRSDEDADMEYFRSLANKGTEDDVPF